jgi:Ca2+-binding RTX toxin-like protein
MNPFRFPMIRPRHPRRTVLRLDSLDARIVPAVTATYDPATTTLTVQGDGTSNTIIFSRDATGQILVNGGSVAVAGGTPTVINTSLIVANGQGGNDTISLDESGGALPAAKLSGGTGSDTLTGGSGNDQLSGDAGNDVLFGGSGADLLLGGDGYDTIFGGRGDDTAQMGAGNDTFTWNPGDGNDVVEGQAGADTMLFNGANIAERIEISANGPRVRFTRDVASITMDLDGVEAVTFNALGGVDTVTVDDLTGTDLTRVNVHLAASGGGGDGAADAVIVNGTSGNDAISVNGSGTAFSVGGLYTRVAVDGVEAASDHFVVQALGGNDTVSASGLPAGVVGLTLDGGGGNDRLTGSAGADVLIGGDGNDLVSGERGDDAALLGAGDDVFEWDPGDGSDTVEGQDGTDTLRFEGANVAENIDISANGTRVRFFRDVGNVTMDLNQVERVDFKALGGADTVTVNDLTGTGLATVNLDLGVGGLGDGAADSVVVNGTAGDDSVQVAGNAVRGITVTGLAAQVNITHAEPARDRLTVNGQAGNDTISASGLAAGTVGLTLNGGAGIDFLIGSPGRDTIFGGTGNDTALMGAGDDTFVWNPGDGSDIVEGQAGTDSLLFNGANINEKIDISANGSRVLFTRDVATIVMDLNDIEALTFNALGGIDTIHVHDLTGTALKQINLNLAASGGGGDGAADTVIVDGTAGNDAIRVGNATGGFAVTGLAARVRVSGAEAVNDQLQVNGLAGNDAINASLLSAGRIQLTEDGGDGNDTLTGSAGNDSLIGEAGDDLLIGGPGTDTLNGAPGNDRLVQ